MLVARQHQTCYAKYVNYAPFENTYSISLVCPESAFNKQSSCNTIHLPTYRIRTIFPSLTQIINSYRYNTRVLVLPSRTSLMLKTGYLLILLKLEAYNIRIQLIN